MRKGSDAVALYGEHVRNYEFGTEDLPDIAYYIRHTLGKNQLRLTSTEANYNEHGELVNETYFFHNGTPCHLGAKVAGGIDPLKAVQFSVPESIDPETGYQGSLTIFLQQDDVNKTFSQPHLKFMTRRKYGQAHQHVDTGHLYFLNEPGKIATYYSEGPGWVQFDTYRAGHFGWHRAYRLEVSQPVLTQSTILPEDSVNNDPLPEIRPFIPAVNELPVVAQGLRDALNGKHLLVKTVCRYKQQDPYWPKGWERSRTVSFEKPGGFDSCVQFYLNCKGPGNEGQYYSSQQGTLRLYYLPSPEELPESIDLGTRRSTRIYRDVDEFVVNEGDPEVQCLRMTRDAVEIFRITHDAVITTTISRKEPQ